MAEGLQFNEDNIKKEYNSDTENDPELTVQIINQKEVDGENFKSESHYDSDTENEEEETIKGLLISFPVKTEPKLDNERAEETVTCGESISIRFTKNKKEMFGFPVDPNFKKKKKKTRKRS